MPCSNRKASAGTWFFHIRVLRQNEQLQRRVVAYHGPSRSCGERWPGGARSISHSNLIAPQWQLPCRAVIMRTPRKGSRERNNVDVRGA